jgi:hypothetical protein
MTWNFHMEGRHCNKQRDIALKRDIDVLERGKWNTLTPHAGRKPKSWPAVSRDAARSRIGIVLMSCMVKKSVLETGVC